jgi:hypothetical protein
MINETDVPASAPTAVEAAVRPGAVTPLSETEALDWLRAQPGGRVTMSNAELGREWNKHREQVRRWVNGWCDAGLVKRRGDTVTVIVPDGVTESVSGGVSAPVTDGVTTPVTTRSVVPVPPRKLARPTTSASRIVRRALMPAETEAPIITFVPSEPSPVTVAEPGDAEPDPARVTIMPPEPVVSTRWTRVILILVAIGIGALALIINGQTGWHFGTTPLASFTFAGLAVAADLLAMVLPGAAVALWHAHHRLLAIGAWLTWPLATGLAMLASLGFIELNVSDTAAGRQAIVTTATATADQRTAAITAAQLAATAATKAREGECAVRGSKCRDREADERQALAALATAIAVPVPTAATIAEADPQVTGALRLATWVGLGLKTDDVKNVRLALMALLPNIAGLLFAFAMGLVRPVRASY